MAEAKQFSADWCRRVNASWLMTVLFVVVLAASSLWLATDALGQQNPQPSQPSWKDLLDRAAGQGQVKIEEFINKIAMEIERLDSRLNWMIWSLSGTYFVASLLYTLLTVFFTTYFVTKRIGIDKIGAQIAGRVQQQLGGDISLIAKEAVGSEIAALTEHIKKLEESLKRSGPDQF